MISQLSQTPRMQTIKQHARKLTDYFPVIFFFAGFVWDALTIGRNVMPLDLAIFSGYLLAAAVILYLIGRPVDETAEASSRSQAKVILVLKKLHTPRLPYFLLQFLFGSLFSALFILYFKSSSHWLAWFTSLVLGILLVANEFLESEYKRFTLSWAMFGLCAMLLFNFALPFMLGSIHAVWFYLSTLLGAALACWLYMKTPQHYGSIKPVAIIAALLMFAYTADMIPPVPLVKRDVAVAYDLSKVNGNYLLKQQASSWWVFWRKSSNDLELVPGQRVYCFSSVFAPPGLKTKLVHRWQYYDKKDGWKTESRIGFSLSGGRYQGFRGYTYKSNLAEGDWRVGVETENEKTIAVYSFSVKHVEAAPDSIMQSF
jgi:MFS family permease